MSEIEELKRRMDKLEERDRLEFEKTKYKWSTIFAMFTMIFSVLVGATVVIYLSSW